MEALGRVERSGKVEKTMRMPKPNVKTAKHPANGLQPERRFNGGRAVYCCFCASLINSATLESVPTGSTKTML